MTYDKKRSNKITLEKEYFSASLSGIKFDKGIVMAGEKSFVFKTIENIYANINGNQVFIQSATLKFDGKKNILNGSGTCVVKLPENTPLAFNAKTDIEIIGTVKVKSKDGNKLEFESIKIKIK
jgi:vacuolar-type H+-ATPase subunit E/Vma4